MIYVFHGPDEFSIDQAVWDLKSKVGVAGLVYVGNHGAEQIEDGRLRVVPGLEEYSQKIGRVLDGLKDRVDIPGLSWENKGYSAAVHFRAAREPDLAKGALQAALSNVEIASELQVFWGKMILEIRPPTGLHKGYALRNLVRERGLTGAIFIGDDLTDLDALVSLKEMRDQSGVRGLGVAVVDEDSGEGVGVSVNRAGGGIAVVDSAGSSGELRLSRIDSSPSDISISVRADSSKSSISFLILRMSTSGFRQSVAWFTWSIAASSAIS